MPHLPAPAKGPTRDPNKNVQLSSTLFDSKTGKFIVSEIEHPDPGFMALKENREEMFPKKHKGKKIRDLPKIDTDITSKEFKQVPKPPFTKVKNKVDSVNKSCEDLAIDG